MNLTFSSISIFTPYDAITERYLLLMGIKITEKETQALLNQNRSNHIFTTHLNLKTGSVESEVLYIWQELFCVPRDVIHFLLKAMDVSADSWELGSQLMASTCKSIK